MNFPVLNSPCPTLIFCLLLLLAANVLTGSAYGQDPQNVNPFEAEIAAFEQADRQNPPPSHAILFVGSSSIRMWKSLENDYPGYAVINRGFGGSQFSDLLHFTDRIVLPYQPRQIFVYEGDNDINAGVTPGTVLQRFKTFVGRVQEQLPDTEIVFISIKPSPARRNVFGQMNSANMLVKSYALLTDGVRYADVFNPMLNGRGQIRGELFIEDELHMNARGYDVWERVIRPYLD